MKPSSPCLLAILLALVAAPLPRLHAQTTIIADDYNIAPNGTGFALNTGVNAGINPPTTRLSGSAAPNLRYLQTVTAKAASLYSIANNRLRVTAGSGIGRFTLSADGLTPFNFASALGATSASPTNPAIYDITITMANNTPGVQRFSFALGSSEGDANTWDFGLQLYHNNTTADYYTIGKRVDTASSGLGSDLNTFITNTPPGTYGNQITFLLRITDAGPETSAFHSRVQVSTDAGVSWIYDTRTDPDLPNGWRLDGPGRYLIWDVAPDAGTVTYDNFSVRPLVISAALVSPPAQANDIAAAPALTVALSNSSPDNLTVTFYGREAPKPYPGPDFCIAVLPDTQNYARESSGSGQAVKEMWFSQTDWIVTNRVPHNIVYVAQLGDCVQSGDIKNGNPNNTEWRNATNAMYRLENPAKTLLPDGIPYGIAVGNHDQEPIGDPDGTTDLYNRYFGISHFAGRAYYGGHFASNNDSHFDLFSAGGLDFIVFYFEFARYGSSILEWANAVLATNQHRRCIVITHWAGSDSTPSNFSPHGSALYRGLRDNPNFFMMLGGHVAANGGEGSRTDNYEGRTIRTFISDFQGWMNGGNGYMRLMYFSPSNNTVNIRTYSPWLDTYQNDANSKMSFSYNLQLPSGPGSPGTPWLPLATNSAVPSGSLSTHTWAGLQPKKTYDWFVTVSDPEGNTFISPQWQFTTLTKFAVNSPPVASNQFLAVEGDAPLLLNLPAADPDDDPLTWQIHSQPLDGLIADFNPDTGALTYSPSRGYRGPDRISFSVHDGLTNSLLATLNLVILDPPDTNSNGLPDAWELLYGVTDPEADDDADGLNNRAEYWANTIPTNSASALRILHAESLPTGEFDLSWSSVGGTRYRVQYLDAATFPNGPFLDHFRFIEDEMDPAPYGEPSTQNFTDISASFTQTRFYRIQVVP